MKEPNKIAYITWKLLGKAQAYLETVSDCEGIIGKIDNFLDDSHCRLARKYGFSMIFKGDLNDSYAHVQDVIIDYTNEPWDVVKVIKDYSIKKR